MYDAQVYGHEGYKNVDQPSGAKLQKQPSNYDGFSEPAAEAEPSSFTLAPPSSAKLQKQPSSYDGFSEPDQGSGIKKLPSTYGFEDGASSSDSGLKKMQSTYDGFDGEGGEGPDIEQTVIVGGDDNVEFNVPVVYTHDGYMNDDAEKAVEPYRKMVHANPESADNGKDSVVTLAPMSTAL